MTDKDFEGLAQQLRFAVHELEMAVDVACYHDGANGTRELRERTREMVRTLIDDVERALERES